MTKKEFMNSVSKGREDILQQILDLLNMMKIDYCVIGGLAVNAYVEPVVSLDLDLVVVAVVGLSGFLPTLEAIRAKKDIALATKEVMVLAGELVLEEISKITEGSIISAEYEVSSDGRFIAKKIILINE